MRPSERQPNQAGATEVAIVIPPDGPPTDLPMKGVRPTLRELQKAVGGYIEIVPVDGVQRTVLVVNEEGLLQRLPPNPRACRIARQLIVGTAVLLPRAMLD
jgi:hypothetical protein